MVKSEDKYNNVNELYVRILPALKTKVAELKREKIYYIKEKDIWNYCVENIWRNKKDLRIYELVDNILNIDAIKLDIYLKKNILKYQNINE